MMCGPTAVMNALGFVANNGYPAVDPGPNDYLAHTGPGGFEWILYNHVTTQIESLAIDYMGMDPESGTGQEKLRTGTIDWLAEHAGVGEFIVQTWGVESSTWDEAPLSAPTPEEIAKWGLMGGVMVMRYGRYSWTENNGSPTISSRNGGHMVTITHVETLNDGRIQVKYRNPSTSDSEWVQSDPTQATRYTNTRVVGYPGNGITLRTVINKNGETYADQDADALVLLDDVLIIGPKWGFSVTYDGDMAHAGPNNWDDGGQGPTITYYVSPSGDPIHDAVHSPDGIGYAVLSGSPERATLDFVDPFDDTTWSLDVFASVPKDLTFGRDRLLYVLLDGSVARYLPRPDAGTLPEEALLPSHAPADAFSYDDATDELVIVSATANEVLRLPASLDAPAFGTPLPAGLDLGGPLRVDVSPADGSLWIRNGAGTLHNLTEGSAGYELRAVSTTSVDGFDVDDDGDCFAAVGGIVEELEIQGTTIVPVVSTSPLVGVPAGPRFQIARNQTNMDPGLFDTPGSGDIEGGDPEPAPATNSLSGLIRRHSGATLP
jgi:hypothetical protein